MMRSRRVFFLSLASVVLLADTAFAGLNFIRGNPFTVSTKPGAIAVADFNGDGLADIAVAAAQSRELNILIGQPDWSFNQGVVQRSGQRLGGIAVGDLNGDGVVDIAAADEASKGVLIWLGNGDGTVRFHQFFSVGRAPVSIAIGDFDKQTGNDLAVCDRSGNRVFILLNDGDLQPVFRGGGDHSTGDSSGPEEIVVADLDGDGNVDIAVLNQGGPRVKDIGVLYFDRVSTTGFPAFAAVQRFGVGERPQSMTVGDLDGDGINDIALINRPLGQLTSKIQIRLGRANRFLEVGQEFTIPCPFFAGDLGCRAKALTEADFDNDGDNDLAIALLDPRPTEPGDALQIYANRGDGFFFSGPVYTINKDPLAAAVGDVNNDGRPDVIAASSSLLTIETLGNVSSFGTGEQGADCDTNDFCLSNVCFDFVCCNSVCAEGERCDVPGLTKGSCIPIPVPEECTDARTCEPPLGQTTGFCKNGFCCNEECSDGVCDIPDFEGICVHLFPNGHECGGDGDCLSTFCIDGFCCNEVCDENQRCDLSGREGTCVLLKHNAEPCEGDEECASGICDFVEPRICCDRECTEDEFCSPDSGVCTPFESASPTPNLTPRIPTPLPVGSSCDSGSDCTSTFCVNFVCCTTASCPDGQFCDATHAGTCQVGTPPPTPTPTPTRTPVPTPQPTDTPPDNGGTCGGQPCGGPCCGGSLCCTGGVCDTNGACVITSSSGGCAIDHSGQTDDGMLILVLLPAVLWLFRRGLTPREAAVRVRKRM